MPSLSLRAIAVAAVVLAAGLGACDGMSSTASPPATPTAVTTRTTRARVPAALPRLVVVHLSYGRGFDTLAEVDRRTHRNITILGGNHQPPGLSGDNWSITGFDISPARGQVAYSVLANQPGATSKVYVVDQNGATRALGDGSVERFSPDGRWLAVGRRTWTVLSTANGAAAATSTVLSPYPAMGIQWSPNGRRFAYGEHFERTDPALTSVLHFDAAHHTLVPVANRTISGTSPWYTRRAVLHTVASTACLRPDDVDAARRYAISVVDFCKGGPNALWYWTLSSCGKEAKPLDVTFPPGGTILAAAW